MMRFAKKALGAALAILALPCLAAAAEPLTLSQAVSRALANNPGVQAAQARVGASEQRVRQARSALFPRLDVSEGYQDTTSPLWAFGTRLNQGAITAADFDPRQLNDPSAIGNFNTAVALSVPVYDSGQSWTRLAQAKAGQAAEGFSGESVRQQTAARAARAYLGVQLARKNVAVMEQSLETAKAHEDLISAKLQSGFAVKSDLLRASVARARVEQELRKARTSEKIARFYLNAAMGEEGTPEFDLVTDLSAGEPVSGDEQEWVAKAEKGRPDLQAARKMQEAAELAVKKAKLANLPAVDLRGAWETNTEDFGDFKDSYTLGAQVRLNLFSGFYNDAKAKEAVQDLAAARANVRALSEGIGVSVREAYWNAQRAHGCVDVSALSVTQAEEALRIITERYQAGLYTVVNLLDAADALEQSRLLHYRNIHDFRVAVVDLYASSGNGEEMLTQTQTP
ncbi:MAG: TolC family protein [Thermodesulfobacteriota bacterium]